MKQKLLLIVASVIVSSAIAFSVLRDMDCCQPIVCRNGFSNQPDCPIVAECTNGSYVRKCLACCDACEPFLKANEKCWKMMDLGFCRLGKCGPNLICTRKGVCLPVGEGVDWGRGD